MHYALPPPFSPFFPFACFLNQDLLLFPFRNPPLANCTYKGGSKYPLLPSLPTTISPFPSPNPPNSNHLYSTSTWGELLLLPSAYTLVDSPPFLLPQILLRGQQRPGFVSPPISSRHAIFSWSLTSFKPPPVYNASPDDENKSSWSHELIGGQLQFPSLSCRWSERATKLNVLPSFLSLRCCWIRGESLRPPSLLSMWRC